MLASARNAFGILIRVVAMVVALVACFSAGRALAASNRVTDKPLILTNVTSASVCGRPADGTSQEILCFPAATSVEETLSQPDAVVATKNATCARDGETWKCWGVNGGLVQDQVMMVTSTKSKNDMLMGYADSLCKVDAAKGIVSCTQNYQMSSDPLRMKSSLAPAVIGDHFGPFPALKAVAGTQEHLCFVTDDTLKCATSYAAQKIAERKLQNATLLALTNSQICVIDDSGNRCFNSIGETKLFARPSWKGAKRLVANLADLCVVLSSGDVECLSTNATSSVLGENKPEDLGTVVDLGLGRNFACALKSDRTVKCWSNGGATSFEPPRPLVNVVSISVTDSHACAVEDSGETTCWGPGNDNGQLLPLLRKGTPISVVESGDVRCAWNSSGARCTSRYGANGVTSKMPALENVVAMSVTPGYDKTICAISKGTNSLNKATCWGYNANLAQVPAAVVNPISISLSDESACAILADQTTQCWGKPTGLPWNVSSKGVLQISLASDRVCMIDYFGFNCWGPELADSKVRTPEKLVNSPDVVGFALGSTHSCVLTPFEVECWGDNGNKQLDVPPMVDPISVIAAQNLTCASDRDGVICWGPDYGLSAPTQPPPRMRNRNIPP